MSFLLDTNILSELRKAKRCDRGVAEWFSSIDDDELFLSVLTVGELRRGIALIQRRDPKSASHLDNWLHGIIDRFQERILPIDKKIAEEWGRLSSRRTLPVIDGLLAATARVHGLSLVTRNTKDVAGTGVAHLNPFSTAG